MSWIKNNAGFLLIVLVIVAFIFYNVIQPTISSSSDLTLIDQGKETGSIKVEIKGEIINPGIYNCQPEDRVVDLINQAGGLTINADIGEINRSERLYDEMVIQIPRKQSNQDDVDDYIRYIQVEIKGEIQYPGIYKCRENAILFDLIEMAGGFTASANRDPLNLAKKLDDGMSYQVDSISEEYIDVEIRGEVKYPGVYQLEKGHLVNDLIEAAGGLNEMADISQISLVESLSNHDLIVIPKNDLMSFEKAVDIKGAIHQPGVYYFNPGDRVIDIVYKAGGFLSNANLQDVNLSALVEDEQVIMIPTVTDSKSIVVDIKGEVKYPGVYYLEEGSRLIDAIQLAGGFRPDADTIDLNLAQIMNDQDMFVIPKIKTEDAYIYVEVKGEVILPGVYAMKPGDRMIMLINRAGGFTIHANLDHINLTRTLIDEEIIVVPSLIERTIYVSIIGEVYLPGHYEINEFMTVEELIHLAGGLTKQADIGQIDFNQAITQGSIIDIPSTEDEIPTLPDEISGRININTATLEQLQTLSGIGIILSERIIEYRMEYGPFTSVEEILNVSGVGENIYESIKDNITVE